jgi:hypothetical protein
MPQPATVPVGHAAAASWRRELRGDRQGIAGNTGRSGTDRTTAGARAGPGGRACDPGGRRPSRQSPPPACQQRCVSWVTSLRHPGCSTGHITWLTAWNTRPLPRRCNPGEAGSAAASYAHHAVAVRGRARSTEPFSHEMLVLELILVATDVESLLFIVGVGVIAAFLSGLNLHGRLPESSAEGTEDGLLRSMKVRPNGAYQTCGAYRTACADRLSGARQPTTIRSANGHPPR